MKIIDEIACLYYSYVWWIIMNIHCTVGENLLVPFNISFIFPEMADQKFC